MNQFRFGHAGEYLEWKRQRRYRLLLPLPLIFGLLTLAVDHFAIKHEANVKPPPHIDSAGAIVFNTGTFPFTQGGTWISQDQPIEDRAGTGMEEANVALDRAVVAWRAALHDVSITKPILKRGFCSDLNATACVSRGSNVIFFAARLKRTDGTYADLPTIFMHEIGHILGVPHMESDPLMDPIYQGKLTAPSADSIAVAQSHRRMMAK